VNAGGALLESRGDRLARSADRILRLAADARTGVLLLLAVALANVAATALPGGPALLASPAYLVLLGLLLLSGLAAFGLRAPAAWREWRHPVPIGEGASLSLDLAVPQLDEPARQRLRAALRGAGYRLAELGGGAHWSVAGVRRGWSRFAALASHVALVVLFVGAGLGTAFSSETVFSLLPGEQALLGPPRPGFTDALRLESLDAAFETDGRPSRLDTHVTYLRDGGEVAAATLRVNEPGTFGGFLVHGWTYGPAARLRVTALDGSVLLSAPLPLDDERAGRPAGAVAVPLAGGTLAAVLTDAAANRLAVTIAGGRGVEDVATLQPGEERRIGPVTVGLAGFTSYVTFMSRRDPGMGLVFGGAGLLSLSLAAAFWLPRRRLTLKQTDAGLRLLLRGERFDAPSAELARLAGRLEAAL
jgi:cytochrome c biogenesis protein ResB